MRSVLMALAVAALATVLVGCGSSDFTGGNQATVKYGALLKFGVHTWTGTANATGMATVKVSSRDFPARLTAFDSEGHVAASKAASKAGEDVVLDNLPVVNGESYSVQITSADDSMFGRYALTISSIIGNVRGPDVSTKS